MHWCQKWRYCGKKGLKYKGYKAALQSLQGRVAGLTAKLTGATLGAGLTTVGYVEDNHWYKFYLQQKGNSCGPIWVRTILLAHTNISLASEATLRDLTRLMETGVWTTIHPAAAAVGSIPTIPPILPSSSPSNRETSPCEIKRAFLPMIERLSFNGNEHGAGAAGRGEP